MRLFIALPVSEEAKAALTLIQADLSARLEGWRWSLPENLHLTLAFLGETPVEKIPDIKAIMKRACFQTPAFKVEFSGLGAFPSNQYPRVLYLGCAQGEEVISTLARKLLSELLDAGLLPEAEKHRRFHAHLSLARRLANVPGEKAAADLKSIIAEASAIAVVSSPIKSAVLYQSKPTASGSEYLPISQQALDTSV